MHERSTFLMWQSATQTVLSAGLTISASPLAGAIGPGNWYHLGAGLAAATLIFSIFLVPESRYAQSLVAYGQSSDFEEGEPDDSRMMTAPPVRISERPSLDTTQYQPRTFRSDMCVFVGSPDWAEGWYGFIVCLSRFFQPSVQVVSNSVYQHTFQILLFPNVLWAFCLNGLTM
jgi:hypothetical protein